MREFFGSVTAIFFCFLGYIAKSLWVPLLLGLLMFFFEMMVLAFTDEHDVDNPFMPLYAIFVAIWSITFTSGWKIMEMTLQREWGLVGYDPEPEDRTEFVQNQRTYKRLNMITHKEEYFPDPLMRALAVFVSFLTVMGFISLNICAVLFLEVVKSLLHQSLGESVYWLVKILGSMGQAGCIMAFRSMSTRLFTKLNEFENWKTDEQYHTANVAKRMAFGFVNSYFAIFFVSFMANSVPIFGLDISCPNHHCIGYVEMMIAVIFLTQTITRMVLVVVVPYWEHQDLLQKQCTNGDTAYENQRFCKNFDGLDSDFAQMITVLGYFMLFGADFPLMAMLCLITALVELRVNAFRFVELYQRPKQEFAKDIGTWGIVLDILSVCCILTQSCFLAFTSTSLNFYFPEMTKLDNVFYCVVVEHTLLLFKVYWDSKCAEPPQDVELAFAKKNYERDMLMEAFDRAGFDETVAFYTSDEGDGMFYSKGATIDTDTKGSSRR